MPDFEFSVQQAWKLNPTPIKRLVYQEATSKAFVVEEEGGREVEYSPEAFFTKAESDREWFRKILLADSFCLPVLAKAVEVLALKRQSGKPHAMIVRGLNIPHSHRLYQLLVNISAAPLGVLDWSTVSKEGFDLAGRPSETYKRFFSGEYIALVHCGMVSEGFSHALCLSFCLFGCDAKSHCGGAGIWQNHSQSARTRPWPLSLISLTKTGELSLAMRR